MKTIEEIRYELGKYALKDTDCISYSFRIFIENFAINHFGRLPYLNTLTDKVYDKLNVAVATYDASGKIPVYDEDCTEEELREKHQNIDMEATLKNILKTYPDTIEYHWRAGNINDAVLVNEKFIYCDGIFYMDTPEIPQKMYDCVCEKENKPRIRWILRDSRGSIKHKYMDITPKGDIKNNYNDDFLPIDKKVQELIHSDESSIIILHGKPGTGKTSYIRDLIANNRDVKFYWIDASMFNYIDTSEFIEFLSTCKNSVFVLEDSESILKSRDESHNPAMQSLLSISDGMLGDALKLKFICTFNTDLQNIDKAILRKGRLKIKYEFKDLKKDKVREIFKRKGIDENLAKDMPLCDVYNFLEYNGASEERKKIGF